MDFTYFENGKMTGCNAGNSNIQLRDTIVSYCVHYGPPHTLRLTIIVDIVHMYCGCRAHSLAELWEAFIPNYSPNEGPWARKWYKSSPSRHLLQFQISLQSTNKVSIRAHKPMCIVNTTIKLAVSSKIQQKCQATSAIHRLTCWTCPTNSCKRLSGTRAPTY